MPIDCKVVMLIAIFQILDNVLEGLIGKLMSTICSVSFPQSCCQQHRTRRSQESLFRITALYKPTDTLVSYEEIQYGGFKKYALTH